jgi:hypothetical protein
MMLFTHLAALFCLVITGLCSRKVWIILDASAFARVVASIEARAVLAWLANQGFFLLD